MDIFASIVSTRVVNMSGFDTKEFFEIPEQKEEFESGNFTDEQDLFMEEILENINKTHIGKILKRIASLPEMRRQKILNVRKRLSEGQYELNERLDVALDKVLEDLTT